MSALAVLENLSQVAVGLANGTVVLIYGDLMRERTTAQKIVHQNDEPITGTFQPFGKSFCQEGKYAQLILLSSGTNCRLGDVCVRTWL